MPAHDSPLVAQRRVRLQAWIDAMHQGSQASFIKAGDINQGMLSLLLNGGKSFGEKQAAKLEAQHNMPPGYLVNALAPVDQLVSAEDQRPVGLAVSRIENDIDALTFVMGAVLSVMSRHRPAEAEELSEQLKQVPAKFQDRGLIPSLQKALQVKRPKAKARGSSSLS